MTKYILHGGQAGRPSEDNRKFFLEMTSGLKDGATILIVMFAREKEIWNEKFEIDKKVFSSVVPDKKLNFILAVEEPNKFIEQIKQADVIYLKGGNTHMLQARLAVISDLEKMFSGKVIAGSSAGAIVLAKHYYENDDDTYNEGFGILPLNLITHYSDDILDKLEKLKTFGDSIETKALAEEKYIVVER